MKSANSNDSKQYCMKNGNNEHLNNYLSNNFVFINIRVTIMIRPVSNYMTSNSPMSYTYNTIK